MDFKREYLDRITHTVRASQAVLQYGVGAMVDFPSQTLMTAAPKYWVKSVDKIHDERLEKVLDVSYFGVPGDKDTYNEGISYVRFPEWYFCPNCRRFMPVSEWVKEYKKVINKDMQEKNPEMSKWLRCPKDNADLAVTRIITVCEEGHIGDFPWVKWVHAKSHKKICGNPQLKFLSGSATTEGLESLSIYCENCKARANLSGAFTKGVFEELDEKTNGEYNFRCMGTHPWKHSKEKCEQFPRAKQRGSSSVYFPFVESSLVIPPYSSIITKMIENSNAYDECRIFITNVKQSFPENTPEEVYNAVIANTITSQSKKISDETGINTNDVIEILNRKWIEKTEKSYNTAAVKYRAEEYAALNGEAKGKIDESGDFVREGTDINDYAIPFVKSISLIHKLREVQALIGFTRCRPLERTASLEKNGILVNIKEKTDDWYPAYEVRGEGIFIEFDAELIRDFCQKSVALNKRADSINKNYRDSFIGQNNPRHISVKFMLLHTLAHLLIKQLSFECGYNIASLKERIYCSEANEGIEMQGILIYTASGDSEGTLGGLVRQGRSDVFSSIFRKAVESALYCSNDPVCSLSHGQGRDSLNLAACYSCTLIPETSCEEFNVFLDRATVVGTFEDRLIGLYSEQLYNNVPWKNTVKKSVEKENIVQENKEMSIDVIVFDKGIDLKDESYLEIFKSLKGATDDTVEKKNISEIIDNVRLFETKEKPYEGSTILFNDKRYEADLIWKDSHIVYFSSEHEEEYSELKNSSWKCCFGADELFNISDFINAIKEK